jgi:hypothetical protein
MVNKRKSSKKSTKKPKEPKVSHDTKESAQVQPTVNIRVGLAGTVNLGDYESTKVDISVGVNIPLATGADLNALIKDMADRLSIEAEKIRDENMQKQIRDVDVKRTKAGSLKRYYELSEDQLAELP